MIFAYAADASRADDAIFAALIYLALMPIAAKIGFSSLSAIFFISDYFEADYASSDFLLNID